MGGVSGFAAAAGASGVKKTKGTSGASSAEAAFSAAATAPIGSPELQKFDGVQTGPTQQASGGTTKAAGKALSNLADAL